MNFYDFHIGDYASRTAHLEPMEDLAYRRMLDLYYVRESALPHAPTEIARLIRMRGQEAVIEGVLDEFFELDAKRGWVHSKCEEVIATAQDKRAKAKAAAYKSWDGRSGRTADAQQTHSERSADAERPVCEGTAPSPTTQSHSQKKPPKPPKGVEPPGFEEFYAAYPKKQAREKAAEAFAKVTVPLATLLEALTWQREQETWKKDGGKYVPMPATWLNGKRWNDQPPMTDDEPDWKQSRSGIEGRARQLGLKPWDELEQWPIYARRVMEEDRARQGNWIGLDELMELGRQQAQALEAK